MNNLWLWLLLREASGSETSSRRLHSTHDNHNHSSANGNCSSNSNIGNHSNNSSHHNENSHNLSHNDGITSNSINSDGNTNTVVVARVPTTCSEFSTKCPEQLCEFLSLLLLLFRTRWVSELMIRGFRISGFSSSRC